MPTDERDHAMNTMMELSKVLISDDELVNVDKATKELAEKEGYKYNSDFLKGFAMGMEFVMHDNVHGGEDHHAPVVFILVKRLIAEKEKKK